MVAAAEETLRQRLRRRDVELDLNLRRLPMEGRERPGQIEVGVGVHRIDGAEMQGARELAARRADRALETLDRAEQIEHRRVHLLALLGEIEAAAPAFAQSNAQAAFQLLHVGADRRLRHSQRFLCRREAVEPDHLLEDAQQPEIDALQRVILGCHT